MRFWRIFPALNMATALTIGACGQQAGEEAETELTPADTAMMTPPPAAEEATGEEMEHDTMMMEGGANPCDPGANPCNPQ